MGSAAFSSDKQVRLHLDLDQSTKNATITIEGPADVWFAIGFDAANMADAPYTIVIEEENVMERKLANHMPGTQLVNTVDVISNTVRSAPEAAPVKLNHLGQPLGKDMPSKNWQSCQNACSKHSSCTAWTFTPSHFSTPYNIADGSCTLRSKRKAGSTFTSSGWIDGMYSGEKRVGASNVRTVVMKRALEGQYFTFDATRGSLPFIAAYGQGSQFSYHGPKSRGGSQITMVEVGAPVCVCVRGIQWVGPLMASLGLTIAKITQLRL